MQVFERYEGVLFEESVLAVSAISQSGAGAIEFLGSGFIIAPYLAVTAKHIIDGFMRKFYSEGYPALDGYMIVTKDTRFRLHVSQGKENELLKRAFRVDLVSVSSFSDFAVLRLVPLFREEGYIWRPYALSALMPAKGTTVTAFGYKVQTSYSKSEVESYEVNRYYSLGSVMEIHDLKRDSSTLYFPCFETNARYDGGMSGGPVFSQSKYVVGLISASMKFPPTDDAPTEQHYSHVASLWPLLASIVQLTLPRMSFYPRAYSIQQLALLGYITFIGHEDFFIDYDDNGVQTGMRYVRKQSDDSV